MDISIIIVSYNSGNILKDCLLSIIKNHTDNNPSVEIIVVENYQKQHNTQVIINELVDASAIPIIFIQNPTNGYALSRGRPEPRPAALLRRPFGRSGAGAALECLPAAHRLRLSASP